MKIDTKRIKAYVELHIKKIATVRQVSKKLRIPYDILRKGFLYEEGIPLGDFIVQTKIDVIKEHLLLHGDPCHRICKEFGLRDDTGAKVFRRTTGMTMREFRKKYHRKRPKVLRSVLPMKPRPKPGPKPKKKGKAIRRR
ncbi:MAG: helix-turn-helix transcriptional regulator [Bacteroidetes bacterium]|nr:helix-turn-helix transcriptional regulator [Bacteroidota bacterium]